MKKILLLFLLINFSLISAQEYTSPKETVQNFFAAFHKQDTITMRSLAFEEFQLKSISTLKNDELKITTESYSAFLKSVKKIPSNLVFEELLLAFEVKTDRDFATVWTPYEFYINGELSHCGINNFQLVKTENNWKILSIIDTRRKEACQ